ncbi:MAG: hypothetical protein HWE13_12520 [Gammaproteobacteria bacterium]|nr:hypothetical protein [Gammaproteobacteria bacterium]NVK88950.1 hypothetical protein [Gammaproteobacteria bacterium]
MENNRVQKMVALAKDITVLFRDAAIIILTVLLLAFPIKFNSILVEAGFEEGSVVGFKWKSKLVESNEALSKANESIESLKLENEQLLKALDDANEKLSDSQFKEKVATLKENNSKVNRATDAVQSNVLDVIESNDPLIQKSNVNTRTRDFSTSDYTVGLQTLGAPDTTREKLNQAIANNGYQLDKISFSYSPAQKPKWFAPQSTVFYYSSASREQAEQLAKLMTQLAGDTFLVRRGAGLGVDPARKHLTFFVHYLTS